MAAAFPEESSEPFHQLLHVIKVILFIAIFVSKDGLMKYFYTLLLLTLLAHHTYAQITWDTPLTVTTGSGANLHPRVALNRNGDPYVLWGQTDTRALFAMWNGTGFTAPVSPGGSLQVFAQSWAGPDMAAYGDTIYVVMKRTPETSVQNHMYLVRSTTGGMSFGDTVRIDNYDTNVTRFPVVTTDNTGNPVVAFMRFNSTFGQAKYVTTRSADWGATFSTPVLASIGMADVCDCCPASVLTSGSTQAVLFRNNVSNIRDNWVAVSSNIGTSYATNRVIDTTLWMLMSCPSSGPDGFILGDTLYSVFMSGASGSSMVYFSKTDIATLSSTTTHNSITGPVSGVTAQNYPRIANNGSRSIAVWKQSSGGSAAVAYAYTSNVAGGISGYALIPGASGGVENADVAISGNYVHVVWQDNTTNKVMYVRGALPAVGVGADKLQQEVTLYPNAASSYFFVDVPGGGSVEAYLVDGGGRRFPLQPELSNGQVRFSVSGLATGNYIFKMKDSNNGWSTGKLQIIR